MLLIFLSNYLLLLHFLSYYLNYLNLLNLVVSMTHVSIFFASFEMFVLP